MLVEVRILTAVCWLAIPVNAFVFLWITRRFEKVCDKYLDLLYKQDQADERRRRDENWWRGDDESNY